MNHSEGRTRYENGSWNYQYVLRDHLGNTRVVFSLANVWGGVHLLESYTYYPFGMQNHDLQSNSGVSQYPYRYNEMKHNEELGLDMAVYRSYVSAIGRCFRYNPLNADPSKPHVYFAFGKSSLKSLSKGEEPTSQFVKVLRKQ